MPTTETFTNRDICTQALRKINVIGIGEPAQGEYITAAREALFRLLKSWQNRGVNLWTQTDITVTATTSAAHVLDVRPFEVHEMRFRRNGIDIPMCRLTRDEYKELPNKTTTGTPTQYYVDRQREATTVYVWPVLATASGETFEGTVTREVEDVDLNAAVDVPAEYYEAVVYGLAARLADDYTVVAPSVVARAEEELRLAEAHDIEGSVFFTDCDY